MPQWPNVFECRHCAGANGCRADFDDSMSGTTAITVLIRGRSILVANVGDSRAVLAEKRADGTGYLAKDLSIDQTPYRYV